MKSKRPKPTDAELAILRVLWSRGPSTVREVLDALPADSGYTTILKFLQIMTEKGLVVRDERSRTHIYRPAASEEQTQRQLLSHLLDRAFGGSSKAFLLRALSTAKASPGELAEVRKLLDEMSKGEQS